MLMTPTMQGPGINDLIDEAQKALKNRDFIVFDRWLFREAQAVSAGCHAWTSEQCASWMAGRIGCLYLMDGRQVIFSRVALTWDLFQKEVDLQRETLNLKPDP